MVELEGVYFDPATGGFREQNGTPINTLDMRLIVRGEQVRLEGRLLAITERYLAGGNYYGRMAATNPS